MKSARIPHPQNGESLQALAAQGGEEWRDDASMESSNTIVVVVLRL
jgi:hypothetical protein